MSEYKNRPAEDVVNTLLKAARFRKIFNKSPEPRSFKKDAYLEKEANIEFSSIGEFVEKEGPIHFKPETDSGKKGDRSDLNSGIRLLMSEISAKKTETNKGDENILQMKTDGEENIPNEVLKKFRSIVRTKILKKIDYDSQKNDFFSLLRQNMQCKEPLNALRSAKTSFFVFGLNSRFRYFMVQVKDSATKKNLVRFFLVLNFICNAAITNENRIYKEVSLKNRVLLNVQLGCYIFFVLEVMCALIARGCILEKKTYLRKPWNILNFTVTICSLLTKIFDGDSMEIFRIISIFRFFRILKSFKTLKLAMNSFFKSVFGVGNALYNMIFLILFYSIVGLHFFKGLTENRCRVSPHPPTMPGELWEIAENALHYCGGKACPEGTYCRNPSDYGFHENPKEFDIKELKYGLANYNNIFMAIITNMNYVTFTGWSGINDVIWHLFSPDFVVTYNVSLMLFVGLVLNNMLVAALYESYINNQHLIKNFHKKLVEDEEIKKNKKQGFKNIIEKKMTLQKSTSSDNNDATKEKLQEVPENQEGAKNRKDSARKSSIIKDPFKFAKKILNMDKGSFRKRLGLFIEHNKYFNYFVFSLIFLNIVALCLDRAKLSQSEDRVYVFIDQVISIYFTVEMVVRVYAFGVKAYLKDYFEKFDCFIITVNIMEVVYQQITGQILTYGLSNSLQIFRIFRYFALHKLWRSSAILLIEMLKALNNIRSFFALILVFISITALIGEEMFAFRVRFDSHESPSLSKDAHPPRMNFDNFLLATRTTFMYYLNDEWHEIMYEHIRATSRLAAFYFGLVLITGQMFLMKILAALFINQLLASEVVKTIFRRKSFWRKYINIFKKKFNSAAGKLGTAFKKVVAVQRTYGFSFGKKPIFQIKRT